MCLSGKYIKTSPDGTVETNLTDEDKEELTIKVYKTLGMLLSDENHKYSVYKGDEKICDC